LKKRTSHLIVIVAALAMALTAAPAFAGTAVPGHDVDRFPDRLDADDNGIPDEGVVVNGHYYSVYTSDSSGAYYWDLGDGRVQSTSGIASVDDLDQATLTTCRYVNNYRASFENDPFMDYGSIHNNVRCSGHEKGTFNILIVHESDPRYTGNPAWAFWGTWEFQVDAQSQSGNVLRFSNPRYPH